MKKLIKQQIKKLYGKVELFCEDQGYRYSDFGSKQKTMQNKFNTLNKFLNPLDMEVIIRIKENINK